MHIQWEWVNMLGDLFQVVLVPLIAWGVTTLNQIGRSIVKLQVWSEAHDKKDDRNEKRTAEQIRDIWQEVSELRKHLHDVELNTLRGQP
jgi:hypothetical protein